jgi:mannose-1-phosphate guanylyltransferase
LCQEKKRNLTLERASAHKEKNHQNAIKETQQTKTLAVIALAACVLLAWQPGTASARLALIIPSSPNGAITRDSWFALTKENAAKAAAAAPDTSTAIPLYNSGVSSGSNPGARSPILRFDPIPFLKTIDATSLSA